MRKILFPIAWIGWYGFLEAVRSRLLLGTLCLVLPLMVSTWMLDVYDVGFQVKVVKDLGLNIMSGFGLLIVLFLSLDQIIPDIERRSIYFVLTRIGNRHVYLIGRFLGVAMTLAFFHAVMGGFLTVMMRVHEGTWFWEVPVGAFVIFLKQCVLVSLVLFLTTFATKIVVISLSVLLYVLGHTLEIFRMLADRKGVALLSYFGEAIALVIPDFSLYEMKIVVVHEIPIPLPALLFLALYSSAVALFYLAAGGTVLGRRDL
ncbi:hypothetical protein AUK22_06425 [bacterium CG2_30_54_10]|nr:MAG: hypothetical protein AUK22_06425 [bacterium CG2_30_54_10]